MRTKKKAMIRIQIEVTDEQNARLEAMMAETGVKTKKDLLNNALSLLEWAVAETRSGRVIASVDDEHKRYKELVMPILSSSVSSRP